MHVRLMNAAQNIEATTATTIWAKMALSVQLLTSEIEKKVMV